VPTFNVFAYDKFEIGVDAFAYSAIVGLDLAGLERVVLEAGALEGCGELVDLSLPATTTINPMALSGLELLKHLKLNSRAKVDEDALSGTWLAELYMSGSGEDWRKNGFNFLAGGMPARVILGGKEIEVGEPERDLTRFVFDGSCEIPKADALDLAVIGELPKSFPRSIQFLDLLRANVTKLTSLNDLPYLHRVVVPAVLECIGEDSLANCPRLEELVIGGTSLREIEELAFGGDFALKHFRVPPSVVQVDVNAFFATPISVLDAGECKCLESYAVSSVLRFIGLILPIGFSGDLSALLVKSFGRATFGSVKLEAQPVLTFDEVRFTAFAPPRGDADAEMVIKAFVFSESAQLLEREAAPARPP
jgi:hypothetical protein